MVAENREKVRLVPYDRAFLDLSWDWLRDPEIKALTMAADFTRDEQRAFFDGLADRADYKIWGVEGDGVPIGAAGIKHIEGKVGEFWCYIGERDWWGRGVGGQILERCEDKAREIGLQHLIMIADSSNERSIRAFEKVGFARQPGASSAALTQLSKTLPSS